MLAWIRYFFGFSSLLILTAMFQPPVITFLEGIGWYEQVNDAPGAAVNWLARIIGNDVFPWVAGSVLGFTSGVWFNHFLSSISRKKTKIDTTQIWTSIDRSNKALGRFLDAQQSYGRQKIRVSNPALDAGDLARVKSTLAHLRNWGVDTPLVESVDTSQAVFLANYFSTVQPFVSARQLKEAKVEAKRFLANHKQVKALTK